MTFRLNLKKIAGSFSEQARGLSPRAMQDKAAAAQVMVRAAAIASGEPPGRADAYMLEFHKELLQAIDERFYGALTPEEAAHA